MTVADVVLKPVVPVTSIVSPTAKGDSIPVGKVNVVEASAVVTPTIFEDATFSLKTVGVSIGTNKLLSSVAVGSVPTSTNASPP